MVLFRGGNLEGVFCEGLTFSSQLIVSHDPVNFKMEEIRPSGGSFDNFKAKEG